MKKCVYVCVEENNCSEWLYTIPHVYENEKDALKWLESRYRSFRRKHPEAKTADFDHEKGKFGKRILFVNEPYSWTVFRNTVENGKEG